MACSFGFLDVIFRNTSRMCTADTPHMLQMSALISRSTICTNGASDATCVLEGPGPLTRGCGLVDEAAGEESEEDEF